MRAREALPLTPHRLEVDFSQPVGRSWLGGREVETQLINALGILFPPGERFFARAARAGIQGLEDPVLRAQVSGFIAQEIHHAFQHERCFAVLQAQGFEPEALSRWIDQWVIAPMERATPRSWHLAVTAALEHFTATISEFAFDTKILDDAEPAMRELYLWHAAEEIEHKHVAFDLLQARDSRLRTRLAGLVIALPTFLLTWWGTSFVLTRSGRTRSRWALVRELARGVGEGRLPLREIVVGAARYCAPGFHPSHRDTSVYPREFFRTRTASGADHLVEE
jgi:uncharacterized protein